MVDVSPNGRVLIHYVYYTSRWDEWINGADEARLAPHGSRTFQLGGELRVGQLCDVLHRSLQQFAPAKVVEFAPGVAGGNGMSVHVVFRPPGGDDWLSPDSERIQPWGSRTRRRTQFRANAKAYWGGRARDAVFSGDADPRVVRYLSTLYSGGMRLVPMGGDGNCLFRSIAHQVYGDEGQHAVVRAAVADYMEAEAEWFAAFVVGDEEEFAAYVAGVRQLGTWGDDPEIQAACEIYDRPAEIFAYDEALGARKLRTFHGDSAGVSAAGVGAGSAAAARPSRQPLRLSYFGGGHYDSIEGPGWRARLLPAPPGAVERVALESARARNRPRALADSLRDSDAAATESETIAAALRLSREAFYASDGNVEQQLLARIRGEGAAAPVPGAPLPLGAGAPLGAARPVASLSSQPHIMPQSVGSAGAGSGSAVPPPAAAHSLTSSTTGAGGGGPAATVAAAAAPTLEESILARVLRSSEDDADTWQRGQLHALQAATEADALQAALQASMSHQHHQQQPGAPPHAGAGSSAAPHHTAGSLMDVEGGGGGEEEEDPELAAALRLSLAAHGGGGSSSGGATALPAPQLLPALAGDSDALYNMAMEMTEEQQLQQLLLMSGGGGRGGGSAGAGR